MCGVIGFSISRSMTLKAVLRSVMGLYDMASVGSLCCCHLFMCLLFCNVSSCILLDQ